MGRPAGDLHRVARNRARLAAAALTATVLLLEAGAARAAETEIRVSGDEWNEGGACPSAVEVAAALGRALPNVQVVAIAVTAAPIDERTFHVIDRGDRFVVERAGDSKEFSQPSRQCAERARAAAVQIALALEAPPESTVAPAPVSATASATDSPPTAPALPTPLPAPIPTPPAPRLRLGVELGPRIEARLPSDTSPFEFGSGVGLRLRGEGRVLGFAVGVAVLATAVGAPTGHTISRYPITIGLRQAFRGGPWVVAAEAGAQLEPELDLVSTGAAPPRPHLGIGAYAIVALRRALTDRLSWFLELGARAIALREPIGADERPPGLPVWCVSLGGGISFELR